MIDTFIHVGAIIHVVVDQEQMAYKNVENEASHSTKVLYKGMYVWLL